MNINILKNLEHLKLFEYYYVYQDCILGTASLILIISLLIIIVLKLNYKNLWESVNRKIFFKDIIIIMSILLGGMLLNILGIESNLKLSHVPILLFFYGSILILFIQLIEAVQYKNTYKQIIKRTLNIYIGAIEGMIFLLTIIGSFYVLQLMVSILSIILLRILSYIIDDNKKNNIEDDNTLREDYPIEKVEKLFESRKRQLNSICEELKKFHGERESFAVAISGKWGIGKTSFVNALEKKIERAEFVHIECAIGYDVKEILNEMSLQLMDIFRDNKIYVLQNGIIEKYFRKISEFANNMGYDKFAKIIDGFRQNEEKSYSKMKDLMNEELEKFHQITKKNIYFIVDDMDRIIDENMKILLFQAVRECVQLNHCVTLFVMDYDQLVNHNMSREFFEKYINYQIELCEVKYAEMIENYLNSYFTRDFFADKTEYLKSKEKLIKNYILEYGEKVTYKVRKNIQKLESVVNYIKNRNKQISWLLEIEKKLHSGMHNPRKVKRYLKEIEINLFIADLLWFQNKNCQYNEYSKEPWEKYIIEICFFKTFLQESYMQMIKAKDFYLLKKDEKNSFIANLVIEDLNLEAKKYNELIEILVYRLYVVDSNIDKSEHQKLLDEIDKDRIKEENILSYLNECMGIRIDFDRLDKIIYFLLENELSNADYQSEVIIKIVEALDFSEYNLRQTRFYEMIKKIKRLVDEKTIEEDRMQMNLILEEIQEKFISINLCGIVDLLKIIYGDLNQKEFENVRRISQLLVVIKKINEVADNKIKIHQVNKDVENIANYFCNLEKEFCKEDFLEIKEECLYFLQPIKNMFKILELLYKEAEEVYNIGLEKVNIRNVQSIIQKVERRERKQLANDEKDLFAEEFMQLAYEIKQKLHIYTEDEKKKMLRMLNETYNKLDKETNIRKRAEKEWRWLRIDLFKLNKRYNFTS